MKVLLSAPCFFRPVVFALVLCCFVGGLAGCGFEPLYGSQRGDKAAAQLAAVRVAPIPDASGVMLRNQLIDRLPAPNGAGRYRLEANLTETKTGAIIARDATVTRQQLRNQVSARLVDLQTGRVVWQQSLFATAGYNVLGSQFSTLISEEDARARNLRDLAERLVRMMTGALAREA